MSYCRWSCDDFQCDIYCYESSAGYEIHVAGLKRIFKEPLPDPVDLKDMDKFFERHRKIMKMCEDSDLVNIGLPCDGRSYCFDTPKEAADKLIELKKMGYNVPNYAIDELNEEK